MKSTKQGSAKNGRETRPFAPFIYKNASFYQDRLGTHIGKALKKGRVSAGLIRNCTVRNGVQLLPATKNYPVGNVYCFCCLLAVWLSACCLLAVCLLPAACCLLSAACCLLSTSATSLRNQMLTASGYIGGCGRARVWHGHRSRYGEHNVQQLHSPRGAGGHPHQVSADAVWLRAEHSLRRHSDLQPVCL
jgi:hypothetical protein